MATGEKFVVPEHSFPKWVEYEWQTAVTRVRGAPPAQRLWDLVFTPAERQQLGGDLETAYREHGSAVGMWRHLHGVSVPHAVIAVGTRLRLTDPDMGRALLQAFGRAPADPEEAIEWAIATGGLVLREKPNTAHWMGTPIPIGWDRLTSLWDFLSELARCAKANGSLDNLGWESEERTDPDAIKKVKARLVNKEGFPITLADQIISVGQRTYRLEVPAEQIHIFETILEERIREWTP